MKKTPLAILISNLLVSSLVFAEADLSDEVKKILSKEGIITLDSSDSESLLNSNGHLILSESIDNVIYVKDTPSGTKTIFGGYEGYKTEYGNTNTYDVSVTDNTVVMTGGTVSGDSFETTYYEAVNAALAGSFLNLSDRGSFGGKNVNTNSSGKVFLYSTIIEDQLYGSFSYVEIKTDDSGTTVESSNTGEVFSQNSLHKGNTYGSYLDAKAEIDGSEYPVLTGLSIGKVSIYSNSTLQGDLYGAYAYGSISTYAYAPETETESSMNIIANGNIISDNGNIQGNIYGTFVKTYSIAPEIFNIASVGKVSKNGGEVNGNVYGSYIQLNESFGRKSLNTNITSNSIISLSGDLIFRKKDNTYSELWGGYIVLPTKEDADKINPLFDMVYGDTSYLEVANYNIFSGNILNMSSSPITVSKLGNFENYNFAINDYNNATVYDKKESIQSDSVALITVTSLLTNNDTVKQTETIKNQSKVALTGISGTAESTLAVNNAVNLITLNGATATQGSDNSTLNEFFDLETSNAENSKVKVGLTGSAEVEYSASDTSVIATIKSVNRADKDAIDKNVKSLAEGRLAGLSNVVRGADSLIQVLSLKHKDAGTFSPIATLDGGITKYNSGSHIDSHDYRFLVGSRYQILDNLHAGLAFDYGHSNFDSSNSFSSGDIEGSGNTYNYGVSLFGKYSHFLNNDEFYIDGTLRFGRTSTEFNSDDIITGSGDSASYKSKANYIGGALGVGYLYMLNDTYGLDSSVRYLYTRLGSDSVVIDGDKVNFDKSTSSRVQLKEQLNYQQSDTLTFTLAGIYEYEFDGKAKANVSGIGINAPSVQGSTGIIELGVKAKPIEDNANFSVDLKFRGYSGKRDGVNAFAMIKYDF